MASEEAKKDAEPAPAAQNKPHPADSFTLQGWLDVCLLAELEARRNRWMALISLLTAQGIEIKPSDLDGDEGNGTWLRVGDKTEIQLAHDGLYYMPGQTDDFHTAKEIAKELSKAKKRVTLNENPQ